MKLPIKIVTSAVLALGLTATVTAASCLKEGQKGVFVSEGQGFTRTFDDRKYLTAETLAGALKMAKVVSAATGYKNLAVFKLTSKRNGITRFVGVATSNDCNKNR